MRGLKREPKGLVLVHFPWWGSFIQQHQWLGFALIHTKSILLSVWHYGCFSAKYTTTLPKWSQYGSSIALVSLHSFERFQMYQMKIDWDNIYYVSVTSSCSNVSNSEQFVSICGRNSNLATITLLAPQPLTSNNRKGNQALNCQNWNLPQTAQCKCIMQRPPCWKTKTSRDPLDCSLIAMRWTECIP